MSKYIPADKLIAEIEKLLAKSKNDEEKAFAKKDAAGHLAAVTKTAVCVKIKKFISTLQQDKETLELCSQVWWEDRGWIMIPPNVTLSGIESLLNQIKRKRELGQDEEQKQPEFDLDREIDLSIRLMPGVHSLENNEQWYKGRYENIKELVRQYYKHGLNARKEE
jgi:hypothetical protein